MDVVVDVAAPIKVLVVSGDEHAAARTGAAAPGSAAASRPGPAGELRNEADYLQVTALAPYRGPSARPATSPRWT